METKPFEKISIVGAGTMGAKIGLQCAVYCYPVQVFSRTEETLQQAAKRHSLELDSRIENQQLTANEKEIILDRIQFTTNMQLAVAEADLVIENVSENLEIKREVFAQLDQICPKHTIFASR